eukprot:3569787-Pyramimonas_sp.AAC.1
MTIATMMVEGVVMRPKDFSIRTQSEPHWDTIWTPRKPPPQPLVGRISHARRRLRRRAFRAGTQSSHRE